MCWAVSAVIHKLPAGYTGAPPPPTLALPSVWGVSGNSFLHVNIVHFTEILFSVPNSLQSEQTERGTFEIVDEVSDTPCKLEGILTHVELITLKVHILSPRFFKVLRTQFNRTP
jgi:hypothetical protein